MDVCHKQNHAATKNIYIFNMYMCGRERQYVWLNAAPKLSGTSSVCRDNKDRKYRMRQR